MNVSVQKKVDLYRVAGIFVIAVAVCIVLGEFVLRPLVFPEEPAGGVTEFDIKFTPDTDTVAPPRTGRRCC